MTAVLTMPRMGETMESGRVVTWLKQPGEAFRRGEVLLEIETDKTTVEMPALDDGRLVEILAREGVEVAVGDALGRYDAAKAVGSASEPAPRTPSATLKALTLPRMGETMEEGRVVAWLKQPGQTFRRGEVILEIETDKTTVEVPALDDGELVDIVVQPGTSVAVGEPVGHYTVEAGVTAVAPLPLPESPPVPPVAARTFVPAPGATQVTRSADATTRRRATPLARRLARTGGLDLAALQGSGRRGRIEKHDVEAALGARSPAVPGAAAVTTPAVAYLDLPEGRLAYREWRPAVTRDTILFLHGFSADGATWAGFAAALARDGLRVVAPDLPGHGATTIDAAAPDAMVGSVAALVDRLDLHGAHLVAHSMGAAIAVRAVAGGLRASRLTLIAPAGLSGEIDADFVAGMARASAPGALAHLLRRLARRVPALSRPQLERMAAEFGRGRLTALAESLVQGGRQAIDIVPDLQALTIPTRIVWGLDDRIIPWTQVAHAPARVAVHLIAGAGHMPHWDDPQTLAALFT